MCARHQSKCFKCTGSFNAHDTCECDIATPIYRPEKLSQVCSVSGIPKMDPWQLLVNVVCMCVSSLLNYSLWLNWKNFPGNLCIRQYLLMAFHSWEIGFRGQVPNAHYTNWLSAFSPFHLSESSQTKVEKIPWPREQDVVMGSRPGPSIIKGFCGARGISHCRRCSARNVWVRFLTLAITDIGTNTCQGST